MKTVKEKLYDYEETPPAEVWQAISNQITGGKVIDMDTRRKRTKLVAFSTAAAAIVTLLIINFVFLKKADKNLQQDHANQTALSGSGHSDSMEKNYELLESIIKAPENRKLIASRHAAQEDPSKYITISGPEGQPVKISPKVATLIVSADDEYPPKPVWNEKINKWQHIMLNNNMAPTSANLLDILQKASIE